MEEQQNQLTADNATHLLLCRHAVGSNGKDYQMRCHILKRMSDGRLKLRVYGYLFWNHSPHIVKVRYVESWRVTEINQN
ncbi:hypothetical protein OCF84_21370 (plasmid) [Shewanella xiamenensis]|uniref:WYL domain-containing protein n=1 Tax=Shewanella xiamenensis TaxID=332186 RepID=A0ABT6UF56_9GAMM|nr:hypothetical protein [Shewanella xiamenensis]MDI5832572.1 hypothetical protein [Shewanella xiamenensis]WHF57809.1 hypothetical protein OCF84_21370 [Shewanella xiamenensis]